MDIDKEEVSAWMAEVEEEIALVEKIYRKYDVSVNADSMIWVHALDLRSALDGEWKRLEGLLKE